MLKFAVEKIEEVEQNLQPLYALNEADKKFYLQVEGVVAKTKLDEFRTNNIELQKKLDGFKDVDPAKYKELVEMEKAGKFKGKTPEEVEALIKERITTMRTELETQIENLTKDNTTKSAQLGVLLIDNVVRDAATKNGVTGDAITDILLRAKTAFKLVDGSPTAHDEKGNVIYGKDGTTPMTVGEWVVNLKRTASHLFPQSQGAGAQGSKGAHGQPNTTGMTANQKIAAGLEARSNG